MFSIKRKVGTSCVNSKGEMRIGAIVDFMQDCSIFQLDSEPELSKFFRENDVAMFLSARQIDILRKPCYGEEISTTTYVYEIKRTYGFRNTFIFDENGNALVKSYSVGAFVDLNSGKPFIMNDEVLKTVTIDEKLEMEYLPRKIKIPDCKFEKVGEEKVFKFCIDKFGHMNNARYLDFADEFVDIDYHRIRVEYKMPARIGDKIIINKACEDGSEYVTLNSENGDVFAVFQFSKIS